VAAEAHASHDEIWSVISLGGQSIALARQGEAAAARAAAEATLKGAAEFGGRFAALGHTVLGYAALAAGDTTAAHQAREAANQHMTVVVGAQAAMRRVWSAEAALADGDLAVARRCADEAFSTTTGWYSAPALTVRARVAIAAGELQPAERDAHDALVLGAESRRTCSFPTSSNASPLWPTRPAVTATLSASAARLRTRLRPFRGAPRTMRRSWRQDLAGHRHDGACVGVFAARPRARSVPVGIRTDRVGRLDW